MKTLIFGWLLTACFACSAQKTATICGVINGVGNSVVYLGNKPDGISNAFAAVTYDSVFADNDSFEFKNFKFKEVNCYSLEYPGYKGLAFVRN